MNIVCILAGGIGNRFGSPVPKQYHLIQGRPVIEYVIDAAVKSSADEVLVVADAERIDELERKYGVIAIRGGKNRNRSIGNAISYISRQYACDKIILVDAVCPLVRADLFDLYFSYLNEYSAVFTAGEITTSLARADGAPVNRREYYLIESPDAYRFDLLQRSFDPDSLYTTPLHMLPREARIKYYFDFKEYMKVMYPHDLAVAEALMKEHERHVRFEAHADDAVLELFAKLRKMDRQGTKQWEKQIDRDVERLFAKWEIYEFTVNRDAYTGLVLECRSRKYGNVVLKMYPAFLSGRFIKESFILSTLREYPQAPLLAVDEKRCAMLLGRVIPGDYIQYEEDKAEIAEMFRQMMRHRIRVSETQSIPPQIKGVVELTEDEFETAARYAYHPTLIRYLLSCAREVYEQRLAGEEKYLLHGDAYYKNALRAQHGIQVIDPVGYADAFVFEYMPFLTYELVMHAKPEEYMTRYRDLVAFFSAFTDTRLFDAAAFVFLVKQLVPSIYEANDGYLRADRYLRLIRALFLDENDLYVPDKAAFDRAYPGSV